VILRDSVDQSIQVKVERIKSKLLLLKDDQDSILLDLIISYFSIIKLETIEQRTRNDAINRAYKLSTYFEKVLHDISIFSVHIKLETNNAVDISVLTKESTQHKRCLKAVQDNVSATTLSKLVSEGVHVLKVFKIQHTYLSCDLQVHLNNINWSFAIHGLLAHEPPAVAI